MNVTRTFPIQPACFDFVFSEHHIEHISYKNAVFMLQEVFRILKAGGIIRITTPDLKNSVKFYLENADIPGTNPNGYLYSGFHQAVNYIPVDDYARAHEVNDLFYNYNHQFIYEFESLRRVLQHAGFINIKNLSQQNSVH